MATVPRRSPSRSPRSANARRAFTLLEVILASILLMFVVSAVIGTVTFINRAEEGRRHRMAALEIGSRLMLFFVDDEDALKEPGLNPGVPYEDLPTGYVFWWDIEREPVAIDQDLAQSNQMISALELVHVRVYAGLGRIGDSPAQIGRGDQLASISRLYHQLGSQLTDTRFDSKGRTTIKAANRAMDLARKQGVGSGGRPVNSGPPTGGGTRR
ncbi:MAG: hypothetical protein ACT4PL_04925 [Phycisphaerales bacterium]